MTVDTLPITVAQLSGESKLDFEERRDRTRHADIIDRLADLEAWRHRVEVEAVRKLSDLVARHDKLDDAIDLLAKTQNELAAAHQALTHQVGGLQSMFQQTRTIVITFFVTATSLTAVFLLGPGEALRALITR